MELDDIYQAFPLGGDYPHYSDNSQKQSWFGPGCYSSKILAYHINPDSDIFKPVDESSDNKFEIINSTETCVQSVLVSLRKIKEK